MKTAHLTIHGRVHGVGFRQFVKSNAQKLDLVGWVQNNDDRTVECMLQGEDDMVEVMISLCQKGPMLSEIKNVEINYMEEPFDFTEFEIVQAEDMDKI